MGLGRGAVITPSSLVLHHQIKWQAGRQTPVCVFK